MTTIPLQGRKRFSTELLYRSEKLKNLPVTLKTRENTGYPSQPAASRINQLLGAFLPATFVIYIIIYFQRQIICFFTGADI